MSSSAGPLVSPRSSFARACFVFNVLVAIAACSSSQGATNAAETTDDAPTDDDGTSTKKKVGTEDASATSEDKAAACTDVLGEALTNSFGRIDGTVYAVIPPAHPTCPLPNKDHLVIEVEMKGDVYRMVVNVKSYSTAADGSDTDVFIGTTNHDLVGGTWEEGWHENASLDYASDLSVHKADFTPKPMDQLTADITDALNVGEKISVFATSTGSTNPTYVGSAHLVHRNGGAHDGAIVTSPTSGAPHFFLFAFDEQSF